jgi:pilus assembly protein CpaC
MKNNRSSSLLKIRFGVMALLVCFTVGLALPQQALSASKPKPSTTAPQSILKLPTPVTEIGPHVDAILGKSTLVRLPAPVVRISVGNPSVADVVLINPREVYLLGKSIGSTNVILWGKSGQATIVDVAVTMDTAALQNRLNQLLPNEKNIMVSASADTVVLSGRVSNAVKASQAVELAEAYSTALMAASTGASGQTGGSNGAVSKTVNLLQLNDPQQVMLEVKVAEISKTLLDKLGVKFRNGGVNSEGWTYTLLSDFLFGNLGSGIEYSKGGKALQLDAQRDSGLVRILAEPTIMAISGQKGSFLAGGKVFIPVARSNELNGGTTITLEEKEFGVGLAFTPTVLEGGRINLNVAPEVSELNQTGSPFITASGATSILPSFSVRRASTTVQLNDGQSFAIAGLIKNNISESVKAFPVLGEIPILGALFRSSEFQNDRTELLFIVTPRLVKPLPPDYKLPTDNFIEPTRSEFFLGGKMEGTPNEPQSAAEKPKAAVKESAPEQQGKAGGFEMK